MVKFHSLAQFPVEHCCDYYNFNSFEYFSPRLLMVFQLSLSDSKSPLVSRTLLSILADLNNVAVRIVSIRPLISNSFSPILKPFGTVPSVPVTISITVTLMFHNFLTSLSKPKYFSLSLIFTLWSSGTAKSTIRPVSLLLSFILLITTWSGLLVGIRGSVCFLKSQKILCLILQNLFEFVHVPFVSMIKFQFLAQFPVDHLSHSVVSSLIFPLGWFATFSNYVTCAFVSIKT